jgi:hypothetical protein
MVPWSEERPFTGVTEGGGGTKEDGGEGVTPISLIGAVQRFQIPDGAPAGYDNARAEIGFVARDVPGYGYKVYRLSTETEPGRVFVVRVDGTIQNQFLIVTADANDGTLTLSDPSSRPQRAVDRVKRMPFISGLNRFVDGGDRGDEYNYCVPETDTIVDRAAQPPRIRVEHPAPGVSRSSSSSPSTHSPQSSPTIESRARQKQ